MYVCNVFLGHFGVTYIVCFDLVVSLQEKASFNRVERIHYALAGFHTHNVGCFGWCEFGENDIIASVRSCTLLCGTMIQCLYSCTHAVQWRS